MTNHQTQFSGGAGLTLVDYRPHWWRPPAGRGSRPAGSLKLSFYLWGGGRPRPVVRVLSLPRFPAVARCTATQIFLYSTLDRHCSVVPPRADRSFWWVLPFSRAGRRDQYLQIVITLSRATQHCNGPIIAPVHQASRLDTCTGNPAQCAKVTSKLVRAPDFPISRISPRLGSIPSLFFPSFQGFRG